jgi:hypothetical protein
VGGPATPIVALRKPTLYWNRQSQSDATGGPSPPLRRAAHRSSRPSTHNVDHADQNSSRRRRQSVSSDSYSESLGTLPSSNSSARVVHTQHDKIEAAGRAQANVSHEQHISNKTRRRVEDAVRAQESARAKARREQDISPKARRPTVVQTSRDDADTVVEDLLARWTG